MKYGSIVLKLIFFMYFVAKISVDRNSSFVSVSIFLLIAACEICKERVKKSKVLYLASFLLAAYGFYVCSDFAIFFPLQAFDFGSGEMNIFSVVLFVYETYLLINGKSLQMIALFSIVCWIFGYMFNKYEEDKMYNMELLDNERRLRYELESVRSRLENSMKDVSFLAEVKERNRIAREIHDSVGHSIAGILIQLQASEKLYDRDNEKSRNILKMCIKSLANELTVLRNTVHNIKPKVNIGEETIDRVIKNFSFCKIDYKKNGDFSKLPQDILEASCKNIEEALSNASKYSKAKNVSVNIDINDLYIRVCIKDDGIGCKFIKDRLGISGIKERVRKLNGSISVDGENGFIVVFNIPLNRGSVIFENIDS